jgi:hypothetical protein
MLKSAEIADPISCFNRAKDNEMLFILLERDPAAIATIEFWIKERIRIGKNQVTDKQIMEAKACAYLMKAFKENEKGDGK